MATTRKLYTHLLDALYLLLIVGAGFLSFSKIFDPKVDLNGDNIYYYSLGQALSEGKGYVDIISGTPSPHTHFPAGYPFFISQVMEHHSTDIEAIKWANGYLFLACLVLLYFILRRLSHRHLAFISCFLTAINVHILGFATIMMSDIAYLFVSSVAFLFLLHLRAVFSCPLAGRKLLYQVLVGLGAAFFVIFSYYVRGVGISLLVASICFLLFEALHSGWLARWTRGIFMERADRPAARESNAWTSPKVLRYFVLLFTVVLLFLGSRGLWSNYMKGLGLKESGAGYFSFLGMKSGGGEMEKWSDWSDRIESNLSTYVPQVVLNSTLFPAHQTGEKAPAGAWLGGILFLLTVIFGIWHSGEGRWLFLFYLGANGGILLLWPEQWAGTRFLISLIPYLIFFFLKGLGEGIHRLFLFLKLRVSLPLTQTVIGVFIALCVLPSHLEALNKREKDSRLKDYSLINAQPAFVEYKQMAEYVAATLPDTALVACRKPEIAYIFSQRTHFTGIPYYATEEEVYDYLVKEKVDYVILDHWYAHAFRTIYPAIIGKYQSHFSLVHLLRSNPSDQQSTPTLLYRFDGGRR